MESLVIIEDPALRDTVVVGLRNIPGCHVDCPTGVPDIGRVRRRAYDAVFTDHDPNRGSSLARLTKLRELAPTAEIIVVAESRVLSALTPERARLRLGSFVEVPLDLREFFKLGVRLVKRAESKRAEK